MMPVGDPPENCNVETPVGANARRSSRLKAPGVPDPPRNKRVQVVAATEVLNPRDFVCIQALPDFGLKAGKVLARGRTIYRSSDPPKEQEFWENYRRRQKQLSQGYFTPIGKPYRELGEILYLDPKKFTLYSLGQLAQEPVKKVVQEKTPKEVVGVTTNKYSSNQESDSPEPLKRLFQFRKTGKELRTVSKALARSRHHINSVKKGGQYFQILHQEALQKNTTLEAAQQAQGMRWRAEVQPPEYSSDTEELDEEISTCSLTEGEHLRNLGKKKKKRMTLQSFTPLCASVLIPNPPEAKRDREHLFRQLCAIHWLLEALTLESNSSMRSILTCWNPTDPGGFKKTVKEIEEEKLATRMQELFITKTKKSTWKARYELNRRRIRKMSTVGISQLSSQSSPHGQTPHGSITSTVLSSEDDIRTNVVSSDSMSESTQAKEQQPSLQKVIQRIHEKVSKDGHKQEDIVKKTGLQSYNISSFIKSKSNLCDNMRRKFAAVHEAAACRLHDTLESLERSQEWRCYQKYQALKHLKYFSRDIERIRQLGMKAKREHDEDGLNWFPVLLARLPESVKSDHYVQKILKKLEKHGKNTDLKIPPDTFVKVLDDLQVWELCCPEIAAAVEFVRESIVQMPEEDFSEWLQTRVAPLCADSSTS